MKQRNKNARTRMMKNSKKKTEKPSSSLFQSISITEDTTATTNTTATARVNNYMNIDRDDIEGDNFLFGLNDNNKLQSCIQKIREFLNNQAKLEPINVDCSKVIHCLINDINH